MLDFFFEFKKKTVFQRKKKKKIHEFFGKNIFLKMFLCGNIPGIFISVNSFPGFISKSTMS